ncbi:reverse transcriptase [Gossypium australe]|uniref:Reverse transcriptase n=1 Tax=Gossypium australe TaxID=47621 RepID=A0A5B6W6L9_9ROSI|nr:reverse transcriptase [Gossypium australe]
MTVHSAPTRNYSTSHITLFLTPMLLVCKHDVVYELLDELHGAKNFTKLDLQFEYHQVCMDITSIEKTAF